jgi:excisionase family DNA binding protein
MRLLTVNDFRKQVPISRASVYRGIESGEIPSVRVAGRVLIPESYVRHLMEQAQANGCIPSQDAVEATDLAGVSGYDGSRPPDTTFGVASQSLGSDPEVFRA